MGDSHRIALLLASDIVGIFIYSRSPKWNRAEKYNWCPAGSGSCPTAWHWCYKYCVVRYTVRILCECDTALPSPSNWNGDKHTHHVDTDTLHRLSRSACAAAAAASRTIPLLITTTTTTLLPFDSWLKCSNVVARGQLTWRKRISILLYAFDPLLLHACELTNSIIRRFVFLKIGS